MRKKMFCKIAFTFGLVLLLSGLSPMMSPGVFNNTITAMAADTKDPSADVQLNVTNKSLVKDTSFELKVYNLSGKYKVIYKSDASSVASVDSEGTVIGNKVGTATINATVKDGFKTIASLECSITVGPPAISIKLTNAEYSISVGKRTSLKSILKPDNTVETPRYISSDPEILSVSSTGKVTAMNAGEAYVFAFIENGNSDFCKIIVTEDKDSKNSEDKK